jgi:hypothetical protein
MVPPSAKESWSFRHSFGMKKGRTKLAIIPIIINQEKAIKRRDITLLMSASCHGYFLPSSESKTKMPSLRKTNTITAKITPLNGSACNESSLTTNVIVKMKSRDAIISAISLFRNPIL